MKIDIPTLIVIGVIAIDFTIMLILFLKMLISERKKKIKREKREKIKYDKKRHQKNK